MNRPWFAIIWFAVWGVFQAFAVGSILAGHWQKPEAFPEEAYVALIYPDMAFIPLYLLTAVLLWMRRRLGALFAFIAGGGVLYALIYLFALSGLRGATNVIADAVFVACTLFALWQVGRTVQAAGPSAEWEKQRHAV